ncbi:MAG: hypothetical protein JW940_31995 [Polyangiaceae bacterium]|nr:hypothetical protein [Polyangiaceae bacterium]
MGGATAAAGAGGSTAAGRGNGDTGGIGGASGGAGSQGRGGLSGGPSTGGTEIASAGAVFQAGSGGGGETDECLSQWSSLWHAVTVIGIGWDGECVPLDPDAPLDHPGAGGVVLDDEGQIVKILGDFFVGLDDLDVWGVDADKRYPCFASSTVKYRCQGRLL